MSYPKDMTGPINDGPLVEVYRQWTTDDGVEYLALYMPQPDGSTGLQMYRRTVETDKP